MACLKVSLGQAVYYYTCEWLTVVRGGGPCAQGQINATQGGYKCTLIINLPRVPCPFFPEGRKVMGEKAGGEMDPYRSVSRFSDRVGRARGYSQNTSEKVRSIYLSRQTGDLGRQAPVGWAPSNGGSTRANGRPALVGSSTSTHRFNQRPKGPSTGLRVWVLKGTRASKRTYQEQHYHCILMWGTKAHLHSVTSVISIQMEGENHICDANSAGVLVCRAAGTMCRSVFRTHV